MPRPKIPPAPPLPAAAANPLRTAAVVALAVASLLSCWLVYASLQTGPVPGCDGGDCGIVLTSKWAKLFGVPVGLFGLGSYVVLAVLGARPFLAGQQTARRLAACLVLLIPLVALWFVVLQAFVLKAFCPWCCATHAVATLGAVLLFLAWRRDAATSGDGAPARKHSRPAPPIAWGAALAAATGILAAFAGLQSISPEPPKARARAVSLAPEPSAATPASAGTNSIPAPAGTAAAAVASSSATSAVASGSAPVAPRRVVLHGGRFSLDPLDIPVYGSPRAQHLMVMISDYTCPHCRHAVKYLDEVRESFDGMRLGILMLPSHHGGESLEIQRFMLAAWRLDPGTWTEVSHDLYLERMAARPDVVRNVLNQRLGPGRLDASLSATGDWMDRLFNLTREIHATNRAKASSGSIPQFVVGTELLVGAPADAGELFSLLDRGLGLVRERLPEIAVPAEGLQVGRVFAGTTTPISIPFTNTGPVALQVGRAAVPAGSRVTKGLQAPVPPGQSSAIEISLMVPRDPGPFEQTITLHSNARPPERPVRIRGTVWKPLRITPSVLDFGLFDAEAGSTQGVLRVELDEEVFLESVRSQNPSFTAELKPVTPGRVYELLVATASDIPVGDQRTALVVPVRKPVPTGWPENFAFAAKAQVQRPVVTLPQRLYLPSTALPNDRHQQVLVRCYDGFAGFAVVGASIEGGPPLLRPEVQPTPRSNEVAIKFTLPAGWAPPAPPLEARLLIQTTHPRKGLLEVPIAVTTEP